MREFKFQSNRSGSSKAQPTNIVTELASIDPDLVLGNVNHFLDEISYGITNSLDNKHVDMEHLNNACKNIGAIVRCVPVIMKNKNPTALLTHPDILFNLPNVDIRKVGQDFSIISEAMKIYVGTHDESTSKTDLAKHFFVLFSQIVQPTEEKGVFERIGKAFARTVNDRLHIISKLQAEESNNTNPKDKK